jgi:hypothetical protein
MRVERPSLPDWAERERTGDLGWLTENLHVLWPAAQTSYAEEGRGAIVVDTTSRPTGAGNPFLYVAESGIERMQDADALRMVRAYDPTWELVTMLMKKERRLSTYRIGIPSERQVSHHARR